jgi:hypothetical protein
MVEGSAALELEGSGLEGVGGERPEEVQELRGHAQLLVHLGRGSGLACATTTAAPTAKRPRERGEGHAEPTGRGQAKPESLDTPTGRGNGDPRLSDSADRCTARAGSISQISIGTSW